MATSRENKKDKREKKGGENPLADIQDEVKNSPFNFMDEKIRISKILDPEQRKTEEIKLVMKMLASSVGEASAKKIKEYADRIKNNIEPEEKVKQGLGPAFIKGIDDLLAIYNKENQSNTETEKAIEEGENNVAEIVSKIEADQEKGLNKAEILGDEEGKESLEKELAPFTEEKNQTIEKLNKNIEEIKEVDEVKTESTTETPITAKDVMEKLEALEGNLNALKNKNTEEAKELAELQAIESATAVESSSTEKQPTKAEILKKLEEAEKRQTELGEKIAAKEAELAKIDNKINGVEDEEDNEELKPLSLEEDDEDYEGYDEEDDIEEREPNQENKKKKEIPRINIEEIRALAQQKIELMSIQEGRPLTDKEKHEITQETFLTRKELFNIAQQEKSGRIRKALNATENWWLGLDNQGNKIEQSIGSRASKVALATAITSIGAFMTSDVSRLITRVGVATGVSTIINTALASNKVKEILSGFNSNTNQEDKKLVQKIFNAKNIIGGLSVGTVLAISGPLMAIVAGGGIVSRELVNYYFDKKIPKSQEEIKKLEEGIVKPENSTDNFDINKLLENLNDIEKQKKALADSVRWNSRLKSILNTGVTAGVGFASYEAGAIQNAEEDSWLKRFAKWRPFGKSETPEDMTIDKKQPDVAENKPAVTKTEEVAETKTGTNTEVNENATNTIKATEETTNTEEVAENAPKANNALERMNQANTNLEKSVGNLTKTVANISNAESAPEAPTANTIEDKINIPKEAIIDGKDRVGITYAFRDQLRANEQLAKSLNIEYSKLDDAKYVATEMKNLAIKLGYMDNEGHEIRISEDGVNKVAYVLKVDGNGNPMVEETNIATGEKEIHYQGATFEGKDYEKAYETYSDNKYDYRPRMNLGPDNDPVYPGEVTNMSDNSDPVEMSPENPGAVTDAKNTIDTKLNTEIYNYETVIKSPSWNDFKKDNFLEFINDKNPSYTYSPEEQKIFNFLKADYDKALNKYPGINEYLSNKNVNVEDARKLLHSVNEGGLKAEIIPNTVTDKEISTHDNKEYDYSNNNIEEIRSSNEEFKEIQEVAKSADLKLSQEELKNVQKVFNKNLETIFGKDKSLWNEDKYEHASTYMKLGDETPLSKYLNDINKLGKDYAPENKWVGLQKEQIDHYLMRITIKAEKNGQLELIKPKVDGPDELYQDIKTGKTEVTTRKTVGQKDDLYN